MPTCLCVTSRYFISSSVRPSRYSLYTRPTGCIISGMVLTGSLTTSCRDSTGWGEVGGEENWASSPTWKYAGWGKEKPGVYACVRACVWMHTCMHVYVCVCACMCACMFVCECMHLCACMLRICVPVHLIHRLILKFDCINVLFGFVCACACMRMCMRVLVYMHVFVKVFMSEKYNCLLQIAKKHTVYMLCHLILSLL